MKFFPKEDFDHAGAPSLIYGEMIKRKEFLWESFVIYVKFDENLNWKKYEFSDDRN